MCFYENSQAQILKELQKTVEKSIERKLKAKTEKETDRALDSILNPKKKKKKKDDPEDASNTEYAENTNKKVLVRGDGNSNQDSDNSSRQITQTTPNQDLKPWSKYNFVPGDNIIFQDNLTDEENGEFPSRWDLVKGNAEIASFEGENIINFENKTVITPLMKTDDYLPEVFTIEFDAYFDQKGTGSFIDSKIYEIRFWKGGANSHFSDKNVWYAPLKIFQHGASLSGKLNGVNKKLEAFEKSLEASKPVWRHIAIAFNKRSLKVFVDQFRALNIPNLGFKPEMVSIGANTNTLKNQIRAIKNIRIAEGGKKLYDRVIADGKFITRGILFDVNKATIKPESMGVLNTIAKMMKQHPDLNFSIEGHTDSDGSDDYNLKLSEKRAASVKQVLIDLGIEASRMKTKGLGESMPVADNATPEGKANNRRVEFIKI